MLGVFRSYATHLRPKNNDMGGLGPVHRMVVGEYEAVVPVPLALCNMQCGSESVNNSCSFLFFVSGMRNSIFALVSLL
jgi:hypothetical protein